MPPPDSPPSTTMIALETAIVELSTPPKMSKADLRATKSAPALLPRIVPMVVDEVVEAAVVQDVVEDKLDEEVATVSKSKGKATAKKAKGKGNATRMIVPDAAVVDVEVVAVEVDAAEAETEIEKTIEHIVEVEEAVFTAEEETTAVEIEEAMLEEDLPVIEEEVIAVVEKQKKKKATSSKSKSKKQPLIIHADDEAPSTPVIFRSPSKAMASPIKLPFSIYAPSIHPFLSATPAPPTEEERAMTLEKWYEVSGRKVYDDMKRAFAEEDRLFVEKVEEAKLVVQNLINRVR